MRYYIEIHKYNIDFRSKLFDLLRPSKLLLSYKIYVLNEHNIKEMCWWLDKDLKIGGYDRKRYFERSNSLYSYLDIQKLPNMLSDPKIEDYSEKELILEFDEFSKREEGIPF
jgi:hypothetical protein